MKSQPLVLFVLLFLTAHAQAGIDFGKFIDRATGGAFNAVGDTAQKVIVDTAKAKEEVNQAQTPQDAKETANKAIDAAASTTKEALSQTKESLKDQQDFALTIIGLSITNALTLWGLFSGRKKKRLEEMKLDLEIKRLQIELAGKKDDKLPEGR